MLGTVYIPKQDNGSYATIEVSAPAGSTVSCDGEQGQEISGIWTFTVYTYGNHTIVATNGANTRTEIVNVDEAKTYNIEIVYAYYLYKNGDECTSITGGWVGLASRILSYNMAQAPTIVRDTSSLTFSITASSSYRRGIITTNNQIDMSNFTKLCIRLNSVIHTEASGYEQSLSAGVSTSKADGYSYVSGTSGTLYWAQGTTVNILETSIDLDISSVSGNYYPILDILSWSGRQIGGVVSEIYLE